MVATALGVFQLTILASVGLIFVVLFALTFFDETPAIRSAENFLAGAAYGLTAGMLLAILFSLTITH